MNLKYSKLSEFDDKRVKAAKYFAVASTLIVMFVVIRSIIQQSYPTVAILIIALSAIWFVVKGIDWIGYSSNSMLQLIVLICVGVQTLLFLKLGFISGGPFLMMMTFSLIALLRGKQRRYVFAILNMFPMIGITTYVLFGFEAPIAHNILEFAVAKSTWLSLSITATIFGGLTMANINLIADFLADERNSYRSTVFDTMTQLSLLRDNETGEHIQRCSKYGLTLLQHCLKHNYDASNKIDPLIFEQAVKLHDVGKIAVADAILKKPGKLTPEEMIEMQKHSEFGAEIIGHVAKVNSVEHDKIIQMGIEIAKHHHENWDGSGYPHGRAYKMFEQNIPLESRIMSIIDVYDALRSPRVYKEPCSHQDTLRIMTEMSGKKFDPHLFELFIQISDDFDAIFDQHKDPTN